MARTLATFAVSDAPLATRLRVAAELARAVEALHRRGRVHGALSPAAAFVLDRELVVLAPPPIAFRPGARAGFDAPEVARGRRATRRSDAFSLGAVAHLVLTGRAPFAADGAPESIRRALFEEAPPARLDAPGLPLGVEAAVARLLHKRATRRGSASDLLRALEAENAGAPACPIPTPIPTPTPTPTPTPPEDLAVHPERSDDAEASARSRRATAAASPVTRRLPRFPLPRMLAVTMPLLALAVALGSRGDAALAREVGAAIERGEHAPARRRLDEAARDRPNDPVVEKLRGDLACARGAPGECVRRYRVALAARPELRGDPIVRRNARALLDRRQSCGTRRAAAQLLGQLRDPEALPALEAARRSGGLLAAFCTGDAIERAIAVTHASPR